MFGYYMNDRSQSNVDLIQYLLDLPQHLSFNLTDHSLSQHVVTPVVLLGPRGSINIPRRCYQALEAAQGTTHLDWPPLVGLHAMEIHQSFVIF